MTTEYIWLERIDVLENVLSGIMKRLLNNQLIRTNSLMIKNIKAHGEKIDKWPASTFKIITGSTAYIYRVPINEMGTNYPRKIKYMQIHTSLEEEFKTLQSDIDELQEDENIVKNYCRTVLNKCTVPADTYLIFPQFLHEFLPIFTIRPATLSENRVKILKEQIDPNNKYIHRIKELILIDVIDN